ncbi:phosphoribosylformylglycinamidine synthase subunit PurL [Candidatus Omnitrophota bacterium]
MNWRVEIKNKKGVFNAEAEGIKKSIIDLGYDCIKKVEVVRVFNLAGDVTAVQVKRICAELLTDTVTQEFKYFPQEKAPLPKAKKNVHIVEIAHNPGVTDTVEHSTMKGIIDLGIKTIESVTRAHQYYLTGELTQKKLDLIASKTLFNKLIQHVVSDPRVVVERITAKDPSQNCEAVIVDLIKADDKQLMKISDQGQLFLNVTEMKTIQKHFRKLKRNPTDCELETVAQTWSEHCYHKTFRGDIRLTTKEKGVKKTRVIRNLLKSTIVRATTEINKSWCVSVFHDNAGVIKFDQDSNVCFKVETHNHPSALEPFGGANTGIGGVIRDTLGTGLGAKPICNTDVFCFAPPDTSFNKLPAGTLHPKRVMKGVVSGVRDYGNKMGIPTVNGAVLFDKHFIGNPLVFCGNVGLIPKDKVKKKVQKGDLILVVGGRTGRDGIHGATFSSGELTTESEVVSSGAVQIGDPIEEKKVCDALLIARDKGLYSAITDCGAGGLSSAVGEMGEQLGACVQLDQVPLKYMGLKYMEVWISESQERMVMSVPAKNKAKIKKVFEDENVEATFIGTFTGSKRLELFMGDCCVCDLEMAFLHDGTPKIVKEATWAAPRMKDPLLPKKKDFTKNLKDVLSHYNVCSKEWIIRQYDHEVQGGSVIKPLVGPACDGPSDASVVMPKLGSFKGLAVSNGINVRFGKIDPYWMAASCIDEALRQIVCVGGDISKVAILDNFCWGNPDKPDRLGGLVRAAEGCYKIAVGYQVPFISGKDSLYNEYAEGDKSIAIPGAVLISALGIVNDVRKTITMDLKKEGNLIYCVGETFDECGGSIYFDTLGEVGKNVPKVNVKKGNAIFKALTKAAQKGLIASMHDCSEGGLGCALAEMAFSGNLGVTARLDKVPYQGKLKRDDIVLFSESNTRILVEVAPAQQKKFESMLEGIVYDQIGRVEESPEFVVYGLDQEICVNVHIEDLKEHWKAPLNFS